MDLTPSGIGARLLRIRWFVRAPIPLYRAGLGWLAGRRVLMLEHRGRRSGLPRYVCLEVVGRPAPGRLVIVSGFGARSQWYRNLRSHPECFVSWGRRRRTPAVARFLSPPESRTALEDYATRHPGAWRALRGVIGKAADAPVETLSVVELTFRDTA